MLKKLKIVRAVGFNNEYTAAYYPLVNTIYYNRELDKFPKLKEKILTHEKKHAKYKCSMLNQAWIDITDYPTIQFDKEYAAYLNHVSEQKKNSLKNYEGNKFLLVLMYIAYRIIVGLYLSLFTLVLIPYRMIVTWQQKKKKI